MGRTRERRETMDAKRLDLEAIKQDWQESRWSFASRGGWAENYAPCSSRPWKQSGGRMSGLPYKEAAEAYIDELQP
jgi:hypothetical protein